MADRLEVEKVAAELFATAWNKLDSSYLSQILGNDVEYLSRKSGKMIKGKKELLDYLQRNMKRIKKAGKEYKVFAEIGLTEDNHPCVILAQKTKENINTLILFTIEWGKIKRIDLCTNDPHPATATRTGEYPGYEDYDDDFEHYFDNDPDQKNKFLDLNLPKTIHQSTQKKSNNSVKYLIYLMIAICIIGGLIIVKLLIN